MSKILIVDDDPGVLTVMDLLFRTRQHEPTAVLGGDKAQDVIRDEEFDLMISDMRMDPVDGLSLLKQAQRDKPGMPVIMVTAYDSREVREECFAAGASAYLSKPFEMEDLLSAVRQALN